MSKPKAFKPKEQPPEVLEITDKTFIYISDFAIRNYNDSRNPHAGMSIMRALETYMLSLGMKPNFTVKINKS